MSLLDQPEGAGELPPTRPEAPPSPDLPADKIAALEALDGYAPLRNGLKRVAAELDHWAGIPMPIEGLPLIIEPNYPDAEGLAKIGRKPPGDDEGCVLRNSFYSRSRRCHVLIWNKPDGTIDWGIAPAFHGFTHVLATLGASDAWGIEQEAKAIQLLGTMVTHRQFKHYMLTGTFLESSRRSKLTYMFRRLRPTVVIDGRKERGNNATILCALCMHPIAYYEGSWAGAMCPTDDVIAHLALMRGDEPMLWRRSNQHHPSRPEAGLS